MSTLEVRLCNEQLDELADRIAARLQRPKPLTYAEAGERLNLSERTVTRLIEDGKLQRLPGTHRRLISPEEIDRYLKNS